MSTFRLACSFTLTAPPVPVVNSICRLPDVNNGACAMRCLSFAFACYPLLLPAPLPDTPLPKNKTSNPHSVSLQCTIPGGPRQPLPNEVPASTYLSLNPWPLVAFCLLLVACKLLLVASCYYTLVACFLLPALMSLTASFCQIAPPHSLSLQSLFPYFDTCPT